MFCELLLCIQKLCVLFGFVGFPRLCVLSNVALYLEIVCFSQFCGASEMFCLVKCFRNVVVYLEIVFFLFNFVGFPKLYVLLNVVSFVKCCVFCKLSLFISEMSYFVKCCLNYKILLTLNASLTVSPINTIINNSVRGHFGSCLPLTPSTHLSEPASVLFTLN